MDWNWAYMVGVAVLNWVVLYAWEPWARAYSSEKAKNLARKEDLDKILAEVRAVTIAQKEIESKISGQMWHQQMHWNEKRDLYAGVLKVLLKMEDLVGQIGLLLASGQQDKTVEVTQKLVNAHYDYGQYLALAEIFSNEECKAAMWEHLLPPYDTEPLSKQWTQKATADRSRA